MSKRTTAVAAVLAGAALCTPATVLARPLPPEVIPGRGSGPVAPDGVSAQVRANGSGCPSGEHVTGGPSEDNRRIEVRVNHMTAVVGPGAPTGGDYVSCTLSMDVRKPAGWTFAITKAEYDVSLRLGRGARVTQTSTRWFQGETGSRYNSGELPGPETDGARVIHRTRLDSALWAPCHQDRIMNDTFDLRVSQGHDGARTDSAVMNAGGGQANVAYRLWWKRC